MGGLKAIFGAAVIAAVAGACIYVTFINQSWQPVVDESVAWTNNCADKSEAIGRDEAAEARFESVLGPGDFTVMTTPSARAVVLHVPLEYNPASAEQPMRDLARSWIVERLRLSDIPEKDIDEAELNSDLNVSVVRHDFQVVAYLGNSYEEIVPTRRVRDRFNECIYAIEEPRWSFLDVLGQKVVGRPFRRAPVE